MGWRGTLFGQAAQPPLGWGEWGGLTVSGGEVGEFGLRHPSRGSLGVGAPQGAGLDKRGSWFIGWQGPAGHKAPAPAVGLEPPPGAPSRGPVGVPAGDPNRECD